MRKMRNLDSSPLKVWCVDEPDSPDSRVSYYSRRWGLGVLILSLSTFIFTMERVAVVFAVMITQSFPVINRLMH